MHDFTEPLSLSSDTLLNEAVHCACSKHKVNQIMGVLHFSRTLQKHPWCHFGHFLHTEDNRWDKGVVSFQGRGQGLDCLPDNFRLICNKKKERENGNDFQMQLCIVRNKSSLVSSALLTGCLT